MMMKIAWVPLVVLLLLGGRGYSQNLLNEPESVVYDPAFSRYLVTNKASGEIIAVDLVGIQTYFATGLGSCRGITITGTTAYVACDYGLRGFDLASGAQVFAQSISGMVFLNDTEADTSGHVYISDSSTGKVYKVRISDGNVTTLVSSGLSGSNGLLYDRKNGRLLVCCWGTNAPIYSVNTSTGALTLLVYTGLSNLDGLSEDNAGNIYVSSWGQNAVYRYAASFADAPLPVSAGHSGPADIFFNKSANTLAVPNFNNNTLSLVDLDDDDDAVLDPDDNCPNIPNPTQADANNDGIGDACCCTDMRGNANGDLQDRVNVSDATYLLSYLFGIPAGPPPPCPVEANANGDSQEKVNVSDVTYLLSYLFGIPSGPPPPACP